MRCRTPRAPDAPSVTGLPPHECATTTASSPRPSRVSRTTAASTSRVDVMGSWGATDAMPSADSSARTRSQQDALCQPPCTSTAVVIDRPPLAWSDMHRLGRLLRKIVGRYYRISFAGPGGELGEDGGRGGDGVDAQHAGDLHDLEDRLRRGAVPDRVLDVQLEPLDVQVGRRGVERDVDELLYLRLEGAVMPWVGGELGVGGEQLRIQFQHL